MLSTALPDCSAEWALFLDFDGTLVDIAPTPDAVVMQCAVRDALGLLFRRDGGALAVVSGRPITELDHFMRPLRLPAAGVHGQELRLAEAGACESGPALELSAIKAVMEALAVSHPGVMIEDKGSALALHVRARPQAAADCREHLARAVAGDPDLVLLEGHAVFEVKAAAVNKGVAVRRFMAVPPFQGRRPLFVGDDRTDEDGIAAAQQLGGIGVKIGDQPSVAKLRLGDASTFRSWLIAQAGQAA